MCALTHRRERGKGRERGREQPDRIKPHSPPHDNGGEISEVLKS